MSNTMQSSHRGIRYSYLLFSITIIFAWIEFNGCSHSTDSDNRVDTSRNYTWSVDTIIQTNTAMPSIEKLWGTSPRNFYVIGYSGSSSNLMTRSDGVKWTNVPVIGSIGSQNQPLFLFNMKGFDSSDVWVTGSATFDHIGRLFHYDGYTATQVNFPYEYEVDLCSCVGGTSSHDVWVGGGKSINTYHYDGFLWRKDSLPIYKPLLYDDGDRFMMQSITTDGLGNVYAIGTAHYQSNKVVIDSNYFFKWQNSHWELVDRSIIQNNQYQNKWGERALWTSPLNKLYSIGGNIYKWENGSWSEMVHLYTSLKAIAGTSDNNIFVVGGGGIVYHYNGHDWANISPYANLHSNYTGVCVDDKEVVIVGNVGAKSIILRGKLQ